MKYSLRSLMIAVLVLPPLLAAGITLAAHFFAEPEPQTIPGMYSSDDVQFFAPGPEFKLSREAATMRARKEDKERTRQAFCPLQP
ncbi:MAG: hypothetical protein K8R36_05490 [Planctomycetales bacterium]|nr:hypothetical protein [Planctomycetales bacterium]